MSFELIRDDEDAKWKLMSLPASALLRFEGANFIFSEWAKSILLLQTGKTEHKIYKSTELSNEKSSAFVFDEAREGGIGSQRIMKHF